MLLSYSKEEASMLQWLTTICSSCCFRQWQKRMLERRRRNLLCAWEKAHKVLSLNVYMVKPVVAQTHLRLPRLLPSHVAQAQNPCFLIASKLCRLQHGLLLQAFLSDAGKMLLQSVQRQAASAESAAERWGR